MSIRIVRPVVSIVNFRNGHSTYSVTSPEWSNEYQRKVTHESIDITKEKAKTFAKHFDKLATEIECEDQRPYGIMQMFVQNGVFNSVRKLSVDTNTI